MSLPEAYFLTWASYGTWLHGDERGSVDKDHNIPGMDYAPPNANRRAFRKARLTQLPFTLDSSARKIVSDTIIDHCRIRGWEIMALNVRSTHVHIVAACGEIDPLQAMNQLKAWTTRRLREGSLAGPQAHIWAEGGSRRLLWNKESVRHAINYVMDGQGEDLPGSIVSGE